DSDRGTAARPGIPCTDRACTRRRAGGPAHRPSVGVRHRLTTGDRAVSAVGACPRQPVYAGAVACSACRTSRNTRARQRPSETSSGTTRSTFPQRRSERAPNKDQELRPRVMWTLIRCFVFALVAVAATTTVHAQNVLPVPAPPNLAAKSYILVDFHSGRELVAHKADERVDPASITKVMTAYVIFQELRAGNISLA